MFAYTPMMARNLPPPDCACQKIDDGFNVTLHLLPSIRRAKVRDNRQQDTQHPPPTLHASTLFPIMLLLLFSL